MTEPALNIFGQPVEEKAANDNAGTTPKSEALALVSAKPHHRSTEHVVASGVKLCGDFGGIMNNGNPCTREAGFGFPDRTDGKCYLHSDEVLDANTEKKKLFLSFYENQPMTVRLAAEKAGVSSVTIWRWRKTDPEFDAEVESMIEVVDEVRTAGVKDAAFMRASDPTNSADGLRQWWLENFDPKRFPGKKRIEISGPNGGPVQSQHAVVTWNVEGGAVPFTDADSYARSLPDDTEK